MTDDKKTESKKNGIIRKAFVAPFIIFSLILILFMTLLLDSLLKSSFEMIAEKIHGAEVNITSVNTSFSKLQMIISRVQVTDKDSPEFNQFEIGRIEFSLLWDALLRAKAVINLAEVSTIKVSTKRSYPGKVFPASAEGSAVDNTLENAKEEFNGNVFGDIAALLGGDSLSSVGKLIEGELKSEQKFNEIKKELEAKEQKIKADFKNLPNDRELKNFEKRLAAIKWKDLGNLLKAPKVIKEVDDLKNDIEDAKKAYETANKSLNSGFKSIDNSYKEANDQVNKDVENLSKRAKIPTLDTENMAKILFGKEIIQKVAQYRGYFDTAKDYIPKKKNKTPAPVKRARGKGRDYQFGRPNSYPLLWIKKTKISSDTDQGKVSGQISDITTNQIHIGKPTMLEVEADFPPKNIRNVSAVAKVDMREVPTLTSSVVIGAHPVANQKISDSKEAKFVIKNATNQSTIKSTLTEKRLKLTAKNKITNISFETDAKSKTVKEVLDEVAKRTPVLTLDAKVDGKWSALGFDIRSNLAKAIQTTVAALVQEKINQAKKQIRDEVNGRVAKTKNQINSEINSVKAKYDAELKKGEAEFEKLKKNVEKQKKAESKKAEKSANDFLRNIKL